MSHGAVQLGTRRMGKADGCVASEDDLEDDLMGDLGDDLDDERGGEKDDDCRVDRLAPAPAPAPAPAAAANPFLLLTRRSRKPVLLPPPLLPPLLMMPLLPQPVPVPAPVPVPVPRTAALLVPPTMGAFLMRGTVIAAVVGAGESIAAPAPAAPVRINAGCSRLISAAGDDDDDDDDDEADDEADDDDDDETAAKETTSTAAPRGA